MDKLAFVREMEGKADDERREVICEWLRGHGIPFELHRYDRPDPGVNVVFGLPGEGRDDRREEGNPGRSMDGLTGCPGREILAVAHYDAFYFSPGANDNASAVAMLLEFFLDMSARPIRHPLKIVIFDDEEPDATRGWMGMRGSRAYVRDFGVKDILAVYDFEMCGMGDAVGIWPVTALNEGSFLLDNIRGVLDSEGIYHESVGELPAFYADYHAFLEAGFPHAVCMTALPKEDALSLRRFVTMPTAALVARALAARLPGCSGLIPRLFRHYHSGLDRSEFLSESSMDMMCRVLTRCVRELDAAFPD
ncbi:M28 family peptidase [bacterium]|nr:M28 family peptidase [bacterium]